MAIIKCKMCGGDLNLIEGASTAECEFCGSVQTIPNLDDEKKLIQFERAERLRKQCEFDKAAGIYETIVADFRQEAEAYWGLVLCKYGIEYVDDPATGKKIPTCHRSSFDSIMEDSDFEQALENADPAARKVYREEAKAIEEIRKGIIAVSANEEPYDIFICYKETAEDGERTLDSVLAQDVYDALTDKGYRVFFSRITLEDKLGEEYEPYIFAALNSAKIMLAFGTDYEYFNAVWVKNEWSRFLKLMAKDKEKHLIPCYKGIDAYDMPKEFAKLQAQDMGKVGAIQDLLRGIEKILPKQEQPAAEAAAVQQPAAQSNPTVESYLKRAFMFLEDGDWHSANEYCEKVLDIDPECAQAYLGKLMADLKVRKQEELKDEEEPFDDDNNYQKVLRFGDSNLCSMLKDCTKHIHERIEQEQLAQEEKERIAREKREEEERIARENKQQREWNQAKKLLQQGAKSEAYTLLKKLSGYKDADTLLETIENDILAILAPVKCKGKWGYINEAGKMVIEPQFDDVGYWGFASNGLARVKRDGKWGYINEAGEMVIAPQFDDVGRFASNGLASVKRGGKRGYINEAGKMVIEPQFDDVTGFASNGLAGVERKGKWSYINEAGEMVIAPQVDVARGFASNGLAGVKQGGKWGYINEAGKMVIAPQFDEAWGFDSNGLACVKRGGKWGYINEAGEMVIAPQFDYAMSFASNGLLDVKRDGKWGYINEAGKMVIAPQFDIARRFASNGLAPVYREYQWGYINEAGEMVIAPQVDVARGFASNGLAGVKQGGKWGYINEAGEMVIEPRFDNAQPFEIIFRSEVNHAKQVQEATAQKKRIAAQRRAEGKCQHCGGELKGFLSKKCVSCGKAKDY